MNCAECRDLLVARAEGLLERGELLQCETHLEACAECRAEYEAIVCLQQQLIARGRAAAGVNLVQSVMRRVREEQIEPERETIMSKLYNYRWKFGLGAVAGAAAVVCIMLWSTPTAHATALEIMAKGAKAVSKLASIHLSGQLCTSPADNFSHIDPDIPSCKIELWKQNQPDLKWRVEKPGRVAVMDGTNTLLYIKPGKVGCKIPRPTPVGAFDTDWLQTIANLSDTISNEMKSALGKGWKVTVAAETGADGKSKSIVSVMAKADVPDDDYLKNKFFEDSDTRRVYRFDDQSELLEGVQIYVEQASGETLLFDLNQIDYNQPIDASVWQLDLPADVNWAQMEVPVIPNNDQYASMTVEEAARAFFRACSCSNWEEAGKFMNPINDRVKQNLGGLQIISLGDSFASKAYGGRYVPYEIKFADGHVQKHNLALRKDNEAKRWQVDGGI